MLGHCENAATPVFIPNDHLFFTTPSRGGHNCFAKNSSEWELNVSPVWKNNVMQLLSTCAVKAEEFAWMSWEKPMISESIT
jgi:hypothetical protein